MAERRQATAPILWRTMRFERSRERTLIRKAADGNAEAAETLVARHYSGLVRFLLHLTGHIDEAEELAQDTFLRAWPQLATFEGRSTLRTWLHRIAYFAYLERRRPSNVTELQLSEDACDDRQNFLGPLVEALAVERAISTLPEPLKAAFLLCEVHEMRARDAAEVLQIPTGTVLSRLHTARARLRRQLVMGHIVSGLPAQEPTPRIEGPQTHEMSKAIP